ncbi:hypothetical protein Clacol_004916 [Clathrus columnatus]|uniref:Fungal-type protein kinase domain-containing protein n=1 Tax=Clathrus columnatus TaxID=1419009 RepID=A0AAV5ADA8_9AGAM|nr:hypothetical protein Clacol_004916 [Clathrus columnatus]
MTDMKTDINGNIILISRDLFLENILRNHITPVKKVVKAIVDEFYDKNEGQWKGFPKAGKDGQFYPKFMELANNINDKASKLSGAVIPDANAEFVAEIHPDYAFVSNEKMVKESIDSFTSRKIQGTLFESKSGLCDYMRQIFRQQLDRRFVLGITISFNNISMWLFDRSGGMGMSEPYNIHKNPEAFVGMISVITFINHRIGWDPTLKLYNDTCRIFQPSYQVQALLKTGLNTTSKTEQDISNTQWLLTLIDDQSSNKVQRHNIVLTRRPLLIRTAEGMNGRAVQIHQGCLEKDENKERRSPLVIKTSWQPVSKTQNNQPHEVYFFDLILEFRKPILPASVIKGLDGNNGSSEEVLTFGFIRQSVQEHVDFNIGAQMKNSVGISSIPKVRSGETKRPTELTKKQTDEMKETMAFSDRAFSVNEDLCHVTYRTHMRIAHKVWGWPIEFFKDLRELLTVVQEAIEGSVFHSGLTQQTDHQMMYKYGALNRDVSIGNIIIQLASPDGNLPLRELVTGTRGRLIDLDHAKHTSRKVAPKAIGSSDVDSFEDTVTNDPGELELAALRFYPIQTEAKYYCLKAGVTNIFEANLNGYQSSPKDLGWEDVGTIPFISHEIMTREESTIHNAIHDLESFWWTIIYLCLTRESGGGHRRKNEDVTDEVSCLIHDLFESSDLQVGITKANYFYKEGGATLFDALLTYFPDYFVPLKPMLKRWRDVLVLGYTFKAYEYHLVHKYVLRIIADAINSLPVAPEHSKVIDNEIRRREDDYIRHIGPPSTNVQIPASKMQKK